MATIQLPVDRLDDLQARWNEAPRRVREALAAELYRTGDLSETQIKELFGFETRFQVHALLKKFRVPYRYTMADVEVDLRAARELGILPPK